MKAFMWGDLQLHVIKDTYIPPIAEISLNEIELLPGLENEQPSTILQSAGRKRERVSFDGFVSNYDEYQLLVADYIEKNPKTFIGADGYSQTMIIATLTPTKRTIFPIKIFYSMELIEV